MKPIFLWNGWHTGDVVLLRPLVRHILDNHAVEVTLGCYRNHAYMLDDLGVEVISSDYDDYDGRNSLGALDLSYLCPRDHVPINTWVGNYEDLIPPSWPTIIEAVNRQAAEKGHPLRLVSRWIPDIDFRFVDVPVEGNAVYLETTASRSGHSDFEFDLQEVSKRFPGLNFYCTSHPHYYAANLFDCSRLNIVELSNLSNRCVALVGKGSGPFCCTLTDANRYKPRAIMDFHDPFRKMNREKYRFWDYPGSRLRYLDTADELIEFLEDVVRMDNELVAIGGARDRYR